MKTNLLNTRMILLAVLINSALCSFGQAKKCIAPRTNLESQLRAESWAVQRNPLAVNKLVRVFFHVTRGTVAYLGYETQGALPQSVEQEFKDLVEDFAPYNICFAFAGFRYIDDPYLNSQFDPGDPADEALLQPYLVPGCINVFYHYEFNADIGGSAYEIPNTYCSISNGNIGLWRTISHEVGHCLGLSHTFTRSGGAEFISGNNCSTRGDRVCDTPADPYSDDDCFAATNCLYNGSCEDPAGATNYSPPYHNIMSYWGSENCTVSHFTTGQYERVNSFLETDAGLLSTVSPANLTVGPLTVPNGFYLKTARNSITINPILNITGSAISTLQSQSVTVPPGFLASPTGNGCTTIRATCVY